MSQSTKNQQDGTGAVVRAWRHWLLLFVPLLAASYAVSAWLGFGIVFPGLSALLVGTVLYQHFVNGRSWRSIMWGVHLSDE